MFRTVLRQRPRLPAIAATTLLLLGSSALAGTAGAAADGAPVPTPVVPRDTPSAAALTLKPLPAGHDELVFRGENAVRSWSVYLSRAEAARASTFQLALLNTVSLQPDRSTIRLTINGHVLTSQPLRSAEKVTTVPVRIPAGVLVPGFNAVQVDVAMAHRVDCSVKATYELWALLDPAQTGFAVPTDAAFSARGLDDLAGEPLAADGTTRLHLRLPRDPDPVTLERAALLVGALVSRAHLVRPVVDVGAEPGAGPGLDIAMGTEAALRDMGIDEGRAASRQQDYGLTRDPRSNRPTLIVAGEDEGDLDATVSRFAGTAPADPLGTPAGIALANRRAGVKIDGDSLTPFSELGMDGENFTGRHYRSSLAMSLPEDFYPGNYDKARLLLDVVHAANLETGSGLVFRVNGTLVSSLPMPEGSPERLEHEQVDLPLRFFRPGFNEVEVEGIAATEADRQCDLSTMPNTPRLSLEGTSELEVPHLAHLATLQRITGSLRLNAGRDAEPLHLYVPDGEPGSLGAALTLVANVAAQQGSGGPVRIHLEPPALSDEPGIVIAPAGVLPDALARAVQALGGAPTQAATAPDGAAPRNGLDEAAANNRALFRSTSARWIAKAEAWFRTKGFFYAPIAGTQDLAAGSDSAMVIAAIGPETARRTVGGIALPQFTTSSRQWLVVTASQPAIYQAGLARLVADGQWRALTGQAVSFEVETGQLRSIQPTQVSYVLPDHLDLADVRPVLGGIVSNNIALSAAALILLLSLLGLSTHVLVRSRGARSR